MDTAEKLWENGLPIGRMISGSKSGYVDRHPKNIVYFNANLVTLSEGKFWWGDFDITKDGERLKAIASEIGEPIYVLNEMAGRFENEGLPTEELIKKAVWNTDLEILKRGE